MERLFVLLVAAHSFAVGLGLTFLPGLAVRFAGFQSVIPIFFARQAGAFHLVLATGYVLEHVRHRSVVFLVTAKALAVVFLVGATLAGGAPWSVPFSAAGDALMGFGAWWLHRRRTHQHPALPPSA
jgi:hypothetical protein